MARVAMSGHRDEGGQQETKHGEALQEVICRRSQELVALSIQRWNYNSSHNTRQEQSHQVGAR
jgi:hypothetical protein